MRVRAAIPSDYPVLRELYLESRRARFHWADKEAMTVDDFDIETEDEYLIIAEDKKRILGFASLYLPDNFIHHLFVRPDCFRQGVGSQLLHASVEKMQQPIRLKCVSENHAAIRFYERNGWKKVVEEGAAQEKYWLMEYRSI